MFPMGEKSNSGQLLKGFEQAGFDQLNFPARFVEEKFFVRAETFGIEDRDDLQFFIDQFFNLFDHFFRCHKTFRAELACLEAVS